MRGAATLVKITEAKGEGTTSALAPADCEVPRDLPSRRCTLDFVVGDFDAARVCRVGDDVSSRASD